MSHRRGSVGGHRVGPAAPRRGPGRLAAAYRRPDRGDIDALLAARGEEHGLLRRGGLAFFYPGRATAVLNVTHIEAPLDPVLASQAQFDGRDQAGRGSVHDIDLDRLRDRLTANVVGRS